MTSTHMYQGMDKDTKPSSRILAPPGGGSSNIFGVEPPAPVKQPPKTQQPAAMQENILGQPQQNLSARNIRGAPRQAFNPITGEPYGATPPKTDTSTTDWDQKQATVQSDNQIATEASSSDNGHQQSMPAPPIAEPKEHTSTRVLNPPGGKSTKLW